jgi:hypothetical protein
VSIELRDCAKEKKRILFCRIKVCYFSVAAKLFLSCDMYFFQEMEIYTCVFVYRIVYFN